MQSSNVRCFLHFWCHVSLAALFLPLLVAFLIGDNGKQPHRPRDSDDDVAVIHWKLDASFGECGRLHVMACSADGTADGRAGRPACTRERGTERRFLIHWLTIVSLVFVWQAGIHDRCLTCCCCCCCPAYHITTILQQKYLNRICKICSGWTRKFLWVISPLYVRVKQGSANVLK